MAGLRLACVALIVAAVVAEPFSIFDVVGTAHELHFRGRILAPLVVNTTDTMKDPPGLAWTNNTDIQAMATAMMKAKSAAFDYTLNTSNSIAAAINQGNGKQAADAFRLASEQSKWDPNLVYPLSGLFRKAMFDNLVLDRNVNEVYATIDYMLNQLQKPDDPQKPFGGSPATYAYAILYLIDRDANDQAGKLLAIATEMGGQTLATTLEAVNVAILDQGCKYAWPMLKAAEAVAADTNGTAKYAAAVGGYPAIPQCAALPAAANLPSQQGNVAYSKDLAAEDWSPQAVQWAVALLEGTPNGAGPGSLAAYQDLIYNQTRYFGNFEKAATAIAVTLIQTGPVATGVLGTLDKVHTEVGCYPLAKPLVDAQAIARAMGVAGTFLRNVAASPAIEDCLKKGLLAWQY